MNKNTLTITSHSPEETIALGVKIGACAGPGDVFCLFGDLGAGKTTFVKGFAQALNVSPDKVNSPTYVLLNCYEGELSLFHFDLYRLEEGQDIAMIGCDEFFYDQGVSLIEWPERLGDDMPEDHLNVRLSHKNEQERVISFEACGQRSKELLNQIYKAMEI